MIVMTMTNIKYFSFNFISKCTKSQYPRTYNILQDLLQETISTPKTTPKSHTTVPDAANHAISRLLPTNFPPGHIKSNQSSLTNTVTTTTTITSIGPIQFTTPPKMVRRFSKFPKKPADWVGPAAPLSERKQIFLYAAPSYIQFPYQIPTS